MKRSIAVTVMALGLLLTPTAGGQTATQDSVSGDGSFMLYGLTPTTWRLDAHSGPSGVNPTGTLTQFFSYLPQGARWEVTCVRAAGKIATVGWSAPGVPWANYVLIEDNASPGANRDRIALGFTDDRPVICPTNIVWSEFFVLTGGDFRVVDSEPSPASKDDCKNGGWQRFGVFKNQGECVSFVATGGNNPPAG